jgi:hypothetical protein
MLGTLTCIHLSHQYISLVLMTVVLLFPCSYRKSVTPQNMPYSVMSIVTTITGSTKN